MNKEVGEHGFYPVGRAVPGQHLMPDLAGAGKERCFGTQSGQ